MKKKMDQLSSCLRFRCKLSAAWLAAFVIMSLLAGGVEAQILTNGGFESGLGSWPSQLSGTGSATFVNVPTNMHSGTNALLVTVSSPGTASNSVQIVSSSFAASSSDTYVLRFWANTDTLDANMGVNLLGATPAFPQIPFQLSTNSLAAGAAHYQEYLYAFKASGTVSIAFNFQTAAKYWLDDVARQLHAHSPECLAPFALDRRDLGFAALLGPGMDSSSLGSPHQPASAGRLLPGASSGPPDLDRKS